MSLTAYSCIIPGEIDIIVSDDYFADFSPMQFCIVKKYEKLYEKEYDRFKDSDYTPYALPGKSKNIRIYSGLDREPNEFTPDDIDEYSIKEVLNYYQSLDNQDAELIFYRIDGYEKEVPKGLKFIGYDVGYLYGKGNNNGFSIICDCMFLCRWHGCDYEGVEFKKEFDMLNKYGLFDSNKDAISYLYHYLNQDFAEIGSFCIYEIYIPESIEFYTEKEV